MLTIRLAVLLVIDLHISFRGVARILALVAAWVGCGLPCFSTVRQWLYRLGLFCLRRAIPPGLSGWILIADHTVQMGQHKCFVVLGLPAEALTQTGFTLRCSDVRVLAVEVMEQPTGATIHPLLEQVLTRVGSVLQIVRDNGSDLSNGVGRLQQDHPDIVSTYDVRPLLACLLKARLANCPRWQAFSAHCGQTLPRLRQTPGNFLAPPAARIKARYMNLDTHVDWARTILAWEQTGDWSILSQTLGEPSAEAARTWFEERLGWLREFRQEVEQWQGMLQAADLALSEVQQHGLSRQTAGRFWCRWQSANPTREWSLLEFAGAVRRGLAKEGQKIAEGQTLLGSSDVIESLFGTFKELTQKSPVQELAASVLLLPLLAGRLSNAEIKEGLEAVSGKEVRDWLKEEMGETARARKRRLLGQAHATEQADDSEGPKAA